MSMQYAMRGTSGMGPDGETCGSCSNLIRERHRAGRHYYKCELAISRMRTRSEASDVRLKWAACQWWGKQEADLLSDDNQARST